MYIFNVCFPVSGTNAIMNSCSQFNTSDFQSRREDFKSDLLTQITTNFDTVSCEVTDLQVGRARSKSSHLSISFLVYTHCKIESYSQSYEYPLLCIIYY